MPAAGNDPNAHAASVGGLRLKALNAFSKSCPDAISTSSGESTEWFQVYRIVCWSYVGTDSGIGNEIEPRIEIEIRIEKLGISLTLDRHESGAS
ncbi:hypothetical protein EVAR_2359_1 [Eumeta japonica]|uniref:Uncharacterized protein n=1 Tax=Eumeta variegata TaxID=151549 RepID=A0A4C1SG30_EUMVA|nr:hypothetical protein EVAR_2359_1 [Eumeta japonica]